MSMGGLPAGGSGINGLMLGRCSVLPLHYSWESTKYKGFIRMYCQIFFQYAVEEINTIFGPV